jgi:circadian clock protein KaiC
MTGIGKVPTGIAGLDEITEGGLPRGRPTLVCGAAGCGKTLLGMQFLVRGIDTYGEPGLFISFEEKSAELETNFASLGFDLAGWQIQNMLQLDFIRFDRNEIEEVGDFDLEGLFIRIGHAVDALGAKRVVLDTIKVLFSALDNEALLRSELRRLFGFLKEKGVTAIVTAERGEESLTRRGLEAYVADCVLSLDHVVSQQIATRCLRIIKYRGSDHRTNEYPFLIDKSGFSVTPLSSLGLDHPASTERISTGVARLDTMLGGQGYFRGSSILVTGTPGTGKSSLAASFVDAAARRGEKCLYFAFEESRNQIIRNMRSIGIDLGPWVDQGLVQFRNSRPTLYGLEMHLVAMHEAIAEFRPEVVVIDPISNLVGTASESEVKSMLSRLIDSLKSKEITALCTDLTAGGSRPEQTDVGISSLMDTWILLQNLDVGGEKNRGMYVLKSRGMAHSNQIREFVLGADGIDLRNVYVGTGGILTGSARLVQEARELRQAQERAQGAERKRRDMDRRRAVLAAQLAALQAELESQDDELDRLAQEELELLQATGEETRQIARFRQADPGDQA